MFFSPGFSQRLPLMGIYLTQGITASLSSMMPMSLPCIDCCGTTRRRLGTTCLVAGEGMYSRNQIVCYLLNFSCNFTLCLIFREKKNWKFFKNNSDKFNSGIIKQLAEGHLTRWQHCWPTWDHLNTDH